MFQVKSLILFVRKINFPQKKDYFGNYTTSKHAEVYNSFG